MVNYSIIIPTYNRPVRLKSCLESLVNLNFPKENLEVIVSDDGSEVDLSLLIKQFESKITLEYLKCVNAGPATARNQGASVATNKYLVFLDDDCRMSPDFLTVVSKKLKERPNAMIGGHSVNALSNNIYSNASQSLIDYLYSYFNEDENNAQFITSGNMVISKSQFQKLGGFDTSFPLAAAEDREFCDRWLFMGNNILYLKEAVIFHYHELSFYKFLKQHFNYGIGAAHFHKVFSKRRKEKVPFEPIKFYWELLRFPFVRKFEFNSLKLFVLILFSQIANTAGFFYFKINGA